jgi:hypothetical protein
MSWFLGSKKTSESGVWIPDEDVSAGGAVTQRLLTYIATAADAHLVRLLFSSDIAGVQLLLLWQRVRSGDS